MSPPAPEISPVEERRDHTTRRLVDGFKKQLEMVENEVSSIAGRLQSLQENTVTHKGMMAWAGGFAVAIVVAVWLMLGDAKTSIKADNAQHREAVKEEVQRLRDDNRETRLDVKALYQSQPKRKRQERLEQPIAEDTP
jgi:hypothetical protein